MTPHVRLSTVDRDRFWAKVDVRDHDECWLWKAGKFPAGYGTFWQAGRTHYAHRIAYQLIVGQVTEGLVLDHLCRNRGCVNPKHLREVSHRENILAKGSEALAAINASKTHCSRGHLLEGDNLKQSPGHRNCRVCVRVADLRRYHQRRGRSVDCR